MNTKRIRFIFLLFAAISLLTGISYAEEINLARDCLVTCNRGGGPEFAVDGKRGGGRWHAGWPCWMEIDLGEIKEINKIHLFMGWYKDGRYYQWYIEISSDRKNWKEVVDDRKNTIPSDSKGRIYTFPLTKARFVRLTVTYNSLNPGSHVREIEVYGK